SSLADPWGSGAVAILRRPRRVGRLLPPPVQRGRVPPRSHRPEELPEQGHRGAALPGPHAAPDSNPLHAPPLAGRVARAAAAGGAHCRDASFRTAGSAARLEALGGAVESPDGPDGVGVE